jgi:hypothetical protein
MFYVPWTFGANLNPLTDYMMGSRSWGGASASFREAPGAVGHGSYRISALLVACTLALCL